MRIHRVAVTLTQGDVEEVANEWLPNGFALEHVHIHSTGMLASLKTPFIRMDILLRKVTELAGGVFVFSLEASKGVKVPKRVIQMVLQKLAPHLPQGISVIDHQLVISVNDLFAPMAHADTVTLNLIDGEFTLVAESLLIPKQPSGKDIKAPGEMAL